VLASLHEHHGHSPDQLLARYVAAMRHPLVSMITHPTNRLIPYRPGYELDYDRLFEAAVKTKTLIEIDGAPSHLDLDGALARRVPRASGMVTATGRCCRRDGARRHDGAGGGPNAVVVRGAAESRGRRRRADAHALPAAAAVESPLSRCIRAPAGMDLGDPVAADHRPPDHTAGRYPLLRRQSLSWAAGQPAAPEFASAVRSRACGVIVR
jgi:hypothetical protein